jgi:hypothetical protein
MNRPSVVIALALVLLAGCASSSSTDPSVSGFAMGSTRNVSRGDEVVIRLPAAEGGATKWRVASFDSRMLGMTQRPRLDPGAEGRPGEWTVRFEARAIGETEVVLTSTGAGGTVAAGERRRFRIRIR